MKRYIGIVLALAVMLGGALSTRDVLAGERNVALSVPDMTCWTCPITVRKSLERVDGVIEARVSFEDLTAMVTYDPTTTNVARLIEATTNVGYPSTVVVR